MSTETEFVHVDDWLDSPPADENERKAKEWLNEYRKPAILVDRKWLRENPLFCLYKGRQHRCTGASRFGDIWLTEDLNQEHGYTKRVMITECSNWERKEGR